MSPPSTRLVHDAMLVMEQLEPTECTGPSYREALLSMVTKVCEQDGRTHSRAAIEQAIQVVEPQLSLSRPVRPVSSWSHRRRQGWQAVAKRVRSFPRPTWLTSPVARLVGKCVGLSALVSLGLFFLPWGAVIRFPFATAIHHTGLFYASVAFVLLSVFLVGTHGQLDSFSSKTRESIKSYASGIAITTIVITILSSLGLIGAFNTHDSDVALTNVQTIVRDFDQVRNEPSTQKLDFKHVVLAVDDRLANDKNTGLHDLYLYDAKQEQIAVVASDLNQKECAFVIDHLPDNFTVSHVNHVRQKEGQAVVCPNLWNNDVQIVNRPHKL